MICFFRSGVSVAAGKVVISVIPAAGQCSRFRPLFVPGVAGPRPAACSAPAVSTGQSEIDGIRSPFIFEGVVRRAIHELKYRNLRALAAPLAELLNDYLASNQVPAEVLVPVPLHPKRWRERGYNQSSLLARELGKLSGLPVIENCLIRRQYAPPQARAASVSERKSNVDGAFACRDGALRGKQVVLIDDVATSGATLNACSRALKSVGAASVWGLVMAEEI